MSDCTKLYEQLCKKGAKGQFYTSEWNFNSKHKLITPNPKVDYLESEFGSDRLHVQCYFCDIWFDFNNCAKHMSECEYYPFRCNICQKAIFSSENNNLCMCSNKDAFILHKQQSDGKITEYKINAIDTNWVIFLEFEIRWQMSRI